jgi:hypothetical protein
MYLLETFFNLNRGGLLLEHLKKITQRCTKIVLESLASDRYSKERKTRNHAYYASVYWIKHLSELDAIDSEILSLASSLLTEHAVDWVEALDSQSLLEALDLMRKLEAGLTDKVRFVLSWNCPHCPVG